MRRAVVGIAIGMFITVQGCWGNNAQEMLDTAKFEELQQNRQHARELYQQILADYPNSAAAHEAAERMRALPAD